MSEHAQTRQRLFVTFPERVTGYGYHMWVLVQMPPLPPPSGIIPYRLSPMLQLRNCMQHPAAHTESQIHGYGST